VAMVGRQLKPMEQAGILVAVMVIMLYGYLNGILAAPARKLQRIQRTYNETFQAVQKLARDKDSGRTDRDLEKLRRRSTAAEKSLRAAQETLVERTQTDAMATKILQMAAEKGFMIQSYSRITDADRIHDAIGGPDSCDLNYYCMTLRGRFALVIELLRELQSFPKLAVPRKILVDMPDDGSMLQTEIWFSL
jgi:hypothetical protein